MLRTITFKLELTGQDRNALLDTMRAYCDAFSISAKWGYENQSWNRVDNHNATYKLARQSVPNLPSSLVQGARDCACEALKAVKCKTLPQRKSFSAMSKTLSSTGRTGIDILQLADWGMIVHIRIRECQLPQIENLQRVHIRVNSIIGIDQLRLMGI